MAGRILRRLKVQVFGAGFGQFVGARVIRRDIGLVRFVFDRIALQVYALNVLTPEDIKIVEGGESKH